MNRKNQNLEKRKVLESHLLPEIESLFHTASLLLKSESEAQELVVKSLVTAYRTEQSFTPPLNSRTKLFRTMAILFTNRARPLSGRSSTSNYSDETAVDDFHSRSRNHGIGENSEPFPLLAISESDLKSSLQALPYELRLAVVLSLLEGFSYKEVAEITRTEPDCVRSRLSTGRKLWQRALRDQAANRNISESRPGKVRSRSKG